MSQAHALLLIGTFVQVGLGVPLVVVGLHRTLKDNTVESDPWARTWGRVTRWWARVTHRKLTETTSDSEGTLRIFDVRAVGTPAYPTLDPEQPVEDRLSRLEDAVTLLRSVATEAHKGNDRMRAIHMRDQHKLREEITVSHDALNEKIRRWALGDVAPTAVGVFAAVVGEGLQLWSGLIS